MSLDFDDPDSLGEPFLRTWLVGKHRVLALGVLLGVGVDLVERPAQRYTSRRLTHGRRLLPWRKVGSMVEGVKMRGFIAAFAIAAAVLTGCAPAASFNGSVAGHTLAVADSVFLAIRARDSTDAIGATIIVSDNTGLCETVRTGVLPKPTTVVFFTLLTVGKDLYTTTEPLTTGEFPFNPSSPGRTLFGEFHKYSEDCTHEAFALMSGGAATLSAFNATAGGSLVGNFEVVYSSGWGPNGQVSTDTVSGNLNARFCELDPARTPGGQFRCE